MEVGEALCGASLRSPAWTAAFAFGPLSCNLASPGDLQRGAHAPGSSDWGVSLSAILENALLVEPLEVQVKGRF